MQNDTPAGMTLQMAAKLRDGREVILREIKSPDGEEVREFFDRLSVDSRYTRFMVPLRELSPAMLEAAT